MPVYQVTIEPCNGGTLPSPCISTLLISSNVDICQVSLLTSCFNSASLTGAVNTSFVDPGGVLTVGDLQNCFSQQICIRFSSCQLTTYDETYEGIHVILNETLINSSNIRQCVLEVTYQPCNGGDTTTTYVFPNNLGPGVTINSLVSVTIVGCRPRPIVTTVNCQRVINITYTTAEIPPCPYTIIGLSSAPNCETCLSPPVQNNYYTVCFEECIPSSACSDLGSLCFVFQAPNNIQLCDFISWLYGGGSSCYTGNALLGYVNSNLNPAIAGVLVNCLQTACIRYISCQQILSDIIPNTIHFIVDDTTVQPNPAICSTSANSIELTLRNCANNQDIITIYVPTSTVVSIGQVIHFQATEGGLLNLCCYEVIDISNSSQQPTHVITQTFETCNDCIRDKYYEKEPYVKPKPITTYYPDLNTHCDEDKIQDVSCSYASLLDIRAKVRNYALGVVNNTRSYLKNIVYFARFEVIRLKENALNICCNFLPCCPPCIVKAVEVLFPPNCNPLTINNFTAPNRCEPVIFTDVTTSRCQPIIISQFIRPACFNLTIDSFVINP